jgi:hypothetical protein
VAGAGRTGGPFELGLVPGPDVLARLDAARVGTFYPSSEMAWVVVTPGRETIVEGLLPGVYGICGAKGEDLEGQWDIRDTDEVQTFEAPPPRR